MKVEDILSNEELEEYHNKWDSFKGKYTPETPYNVHSNLPVIGKVFQYKNKPIFRSHIFKNTIKINFNPYKPGAPYLHSHFHPIHYFLALEQICHIGMSKLREDYHKFLITERLSKKIPIEMNERIHFDKTKPSIEAILDVKQGKNRLVGKGLITFYNDRDSRILQTWYIEGFGELRSYANCIKQLKKEYNQELAKDLIKKIEMRSKKRKEILKQRHNLPNPDYLIKQLKTGSIPEQELHNFFSDWDMPQNL